MSFLPSLRLGVNIDHVATVRNARGDVFPSPLRAAQIAHEAGADGITAHLREDRRHIRDHDLQELRDQIQLPLNMEMAATAEMQSLALRLVPHAVCLVPEKRNEVTTEGGLDVVSAQADLTSFVAPLSAANIRVSLFVDAEIAQIEAAAAIGAHVVELHTGAFCDEMRAQGAAEQELARLHQAADHAAALGLEVHAGHGICYQTVTPIAQIAVIRELNIGHFLISESIFVGLGPAIAKMRALMVAAREDLTTGAQS